MRQWKAFWANENGMFSRKIITNIDELEKVINDYVWHYNEDRIQLKLKRTESDNNIESSPLK